jgi:hypothetical protein
MKYNNYTLVSRKKTGNKSFNTYLQYYFIDIYSKAPLKFSNFNLFELTRQVLDRFHSLNLYVVHTLFNPEGFFEIFLFSEKELIINSTDDFMMLSFNRCEIFCLCVYIKENIFKLEALLNDISILESTFIDETNSYALGTCLNTPACFKNQDYGTFYTISAFYDLEEPKNFHFEQPLGEKVENRFDLIKKNIPKKITKMEFLSDNDEFFTHSFGIYFSDFCYDFNVKGKSNLEEIKNNLYKRLERFKIIEYSVSHSKEENVLLVCVIIEKEMHINSLANFSMLNFLLPTVIYSVSEVELVSTFIDSVNNKNARFICSNSFENCLELKKKN